MGRVEFRCAVTVRLDSQTGLHFVAEGKAAYFDGASYIAFDAHTPNYLFSTIDVMRFRMKTNEDEGLIFYAGGNQGDHIALELNKGRLYVDVNLGNAVWIDNSLPSCFTLFYICMAELC